MKTVGEPLRVDLFVHGGAGRMGRAVVGIGRKMPGIRIAGILEAPGAAREGLEDIPFFEHIPVGDHGTRVVVDFSRPEAMAFLVGTLRGTGTKLVSGTTGLAEKDRALLEEYSKEAAVLYDENMSYGIAAMKEILRVASRLFRESADVEIVEFHHRAKKDHPSGTTFALAKAIDPGARVVAGRSGPEESRGRVIRSHSARLGGVPGEHQVYFATDDEVVTISHRALTRDAFAKGAIRAVLFVAGKERGFYSVEDVARA